MLLEGVPSWKWGFLNPAEDRLDEVSPIIELPEELWATGHELIRQSITRTIHW
jgi:hypothetical protein